MHVADDAGDAAGATDESDANEVIAGNNASGASNGHDANDDAYYSDHTGHVDDADDA